MKRTTTSRKSRTDLPKVGRPRDADIVRDGDAPEWTPEMFGRAMARKDLKPVPKKALLSLRIDADVVEWFRAQGAGYQSRMNALLRAYMEAHKQAD
ncbi:MAG: BrnA antitoxin family protein [Gammaproteobacteria bacterium]|nr:BrnA antitoxin family protein [Gammaproteobacteria bacterium]